MAEYGLYGAMVRHSLPLPPHLTPSTAPWLLGMHKKAKLAEENNKTGNNENETIEETDEDRRTNSIASLRKRALEHITNNYKQDQEVAIATIKQEREEICESPVSPALSI